MALRLLPKLAVIFVVSLVLMTVLALVNGLVTERSYRREAAAADIASSTAGAQSVGGPVLVVRYEKKGQTPEGVRVFPDALEIHAEMTTELRYRNRYSVPVYVLKQRMVGRFVVPRHLGLHDTDAEFADIAWKGTELLLPNIDGRGIRSAPRLLWKGAPIALRPGAGQRPNGLHAELPAESGTSEVTIPFELELELAGTQRIDWVPQGKQIAMEMHSDWRHPSFVGAFLPERREIDKNGFVATWRTSEFMTGAPTLATFHGELDLDSAEGRSFGVALVQPVDIYQRAQRSTKYGALFVFLTFAAFFLFESLKRLAIHPVQYGIVGLALTVFYLLLLSFSERVGFSIAYLSSSIACVGITTYYLTHVLGGVRRGLSFGGVLSALYATLYVLLVSEDDALLLGSCLVFVLLSAVMILTRKINWYGLEQGREDGIA